LPGNEKPVNKEVIVLAFIPLWYGKGAGIQMTVAI
jgi:hypothetical protein